ncbi:MarR family winged helix-turn-helix transcriptional regulator [Sphingomonas solaris]|uniref:Winged helix DNA-binding protein n=1 Tax=Alterirhizorhabdus solaris TaxID=2529389 RepID=A0A558QZZ8_9SPHN|nr:MarR family winged helix-turn-helix transcriptional regulator [Sphingomonas solaris]TVV72679.1 winged helix DNA-binding protein [Sphingomonas solaris]
MRATERTLPGDQPAGARRPAPAGSEQELRVALRGLRRILDTIELDESAARSARGDPELLAFSRRMIAERARRYHFFDGHLFADPAWDIMLDLFVAGIERREVPVTNLCFTSNVPDTTVLRWIKTLGAEGLVVRHKDSVDKRRVLVQLAPPAAEAMRRYVEEQMAAAERMHAAIFRPGETSLNA